MKKHIKLSFLVAVFSLVLTMVGAQIQISREVLYKLPPEVSYGLLGMRVSAGQVVFMNNLGKILRYNLETSEAFKGKIRGRRIVDFDLILGQPVFIDEEGKLGGQIKPEWPERSYSSCVIEAGDQGLLLTGGSKMIFLGHNATSTVEVEGINFALPLRDGFVWALGLKKLTGPWTLALFDCYGNLMKSIYDFSPAFDPAGIELGPLGEEDEALISAYENNARKLMLIGSNGHMIWKIDAPDKFCRRDVAFDGQGNLLILEKIDNQVVLSRWKFAAPQG
jgi:hypothetical protein